MKKLPLYLIAACFSAAGLSFADNAPAPASATAPQGASAGAAKMNLAAEKPDPSLIIQERDLLEASFRDSDPDIPFPSKAQRDKVYSGKAAVGVMLDAEGNPTDYLVIRYTHPAFADSLMYAVQHGEFSPRKVKGDNVPGPFMFSKSLSLGETDMIDTERATTVMMNPMENMGATSDRLADGRKGPKYLYRPYEEKELDDHGLKATALFAPSMPSGYEIPAGQSLKVAVSFYVDEKGNVRLPNVETCLPPPVITSVIKALSAWKFEPPTAKKKPVLVLVNRTLTLEANAAPVAGK